ncbi:hypothetical protein M9458_018760, partial [Cirrhinus mrigala]
LSLHAVPAALLSQVCVVKQCCKHVSAYWDQQGPPFRLLTGRAREMRVLTL